MLVEHLSEAEKRLYVLADNRLAEGSEWDQEVLEAEFADLVACGTDVPLETTGFDLAEIEAMANDGELKPSPEPDRPQDPVSLIGDVWECGSHLVGCLDATDPQSLLTLAPGETFAACITDAPYNVKVGGFVTSKRSHREFVMGSGEMSDEVFTTFLADAYGAAAARLKPGGLLYAAMDWRHMSHVLTAAERVELRAFEPLRVGEAERGAGILLPLTARTLLRDEEEGCSSQQPRSAWPVWALPQ